MVDLRVYGRTIGQSDNDGNYQFLVLTIHPVNPAKNSYHSRT